MLWMWGTRTTTRESGHHGVLALLGIGVLVLSTATCRTRDTASVQSCTTELSSRAETAVGQAIGALRSRGALEWKEVHSLYRQHAACDDGSVAEGFDDLIVGMLARRWRTLDSLSGLTVLDSSFESFVLRHISATADDDELRRIQASSHGCSSDDLARLCERIEVACDRALAE